MPQTTNFVASEHFFLSHSNLSQLSLYRSVTGFKSSPFQGQVMKMVWGPERLCTCPACLALTLAPGSPILVEKPLLVHSGSKDWRKDPGAHLSCWKLHREEEEGQQCGRRAMEQENNQMPPKLSLCHSPSVLFFHPFALLWLNQTLFDIDFQSVMPWIPDIAFSKLFGLLYYCIDCKARDITMYLLWPPAYES